jgi:hypothetical protein
VQFADAMNDGQHGGPSELFIYNLSQLLLSCGIESGAGFIHDQNSAAPKNGTCQQQKLALPNT